MSHREDNVIRIFSSWLFSHHQTIFKITFPYPVFIVMDCYVEIIEIDLLKFRECLGKRIGGNQTKSLYVTQGEVPPRFINFIVKE